MPTAAQRILNGHLRVQSCLATVLVLVGCGNGESSSVQTGGSFSLAAGGTEASGGTSSRLGPNAGSAAVGGTGAAVASSTAASGGLSTNTTVQFTGGTGTKLTEATGGSPGVGGTATGGATTAANSTAHPDPAGGRAPAGGAATGGSRNSTGGALSELGGASALGGASSHGSTEVTGGTGAATTGKPETSPLGYGKSTTGCGSSDFTQADSFAAVQKLIDGYSGAGGLCIKYTGKWDFSKIADPCVQHTLAAQTLQIKKKNDITLMGADGSVADFGIHIAASSGNIIIRNMTLGLLPGGSESDAISIEGMSGGTPTNIWVDHNELFSSMVDCQGAGDTAFDGLIDIKKGADNVTVSYNYIHDHHKVSLNGYSDDDDAVRHVTFHHNYFENLGSRTPLQRHGYSHMLNNLFDGIRVSGINVRMGGYSLVEGNYFLNSQNPVTSRDSPELGYWELRNNNIRTPADFASYKITWVPSDESTSKDATDWTTTAVFPISLGYSYSADPVECVKAGLHAVAGSGKALATLKCN